MAIEKKLGQILRSKGFKLAVAESCTGGLIGHTVTQEASSSDYFLGGVVAYSNFLKESLLGVKVELLREHGAVSREVALAMAEGVKKIARADIGLAVTGIAGPDGGTPQKAVGLVYIAVAGHRGPTCQQYQLKGDRSSIKLQAAQGALSLLLDYIEDRGFEQG